MYLLWTHLVSLELPGQTRWLGKSHFYCDCKKTPLLLESSWSIKRTALREEDAAFHRLIISFSSTESETSAVKHSVSGRPWRVQLLSTIGVKWSEGKLNGSRPVNGYSTWRPISFHQLCIRIFISLSMVTFFDWWMRRSKSGLLSPENEKKTLLVCSFTYFGTNLVESALTKKFSVLSVERFWSGGILDQMEKCHEVQNTLRRRRRNSRWEILWSPLYVDY